MILENQTKTTYLKDNNLNSSIPGDKHGIMAEEWLLYLSGWLRQSLVPLTAAWLHFSSNGYSTVHNWRHWAAVWGVKRHCLAHCISWNNFCLTDSWLHYTEDFVITLRFCDWFWWLVALHFEFFWISPQISGTCRLESCHSSVFLWLSIALVFEACKVLSLFCIPTFLQHHEIYKLSFFHQVFLSWDLGADYYSRLP